MFLPPRTVTGYGRPCALDIDIFYELLNDQGMPARAYSVKKNGFHIIAVRDVYGDVRYYSRNGHELTNSGCRKLVAIGVYIKENHPNLDPYLVELDGLSTMRFTAFALHFEFVASRTDGRECFEDLFLGRCVENGRLNQTAYKYNIFIHDALFELHAKLMKVSWCDRIGAIQMAFGHDMCVEWIRSWEDLRRCLLTEEGVVAYDRYFQFEIRDPEVLKIKLYKFVVRAQLVAVQNTIPGFEGFDQMLFCLPTENDCLRAIYQIDLRLVFTDYTRVKKGKAFVNQHSVGRKNSLLRCKSSSVLGPLLDSLYKLLGSAELRHIASPVMRTADDFRHGKVLCGAGRSFGLSPNWRYLKSPIQVTLGAMELWPLDRNEVHMQAVKVISLEDYGQEHLNELPVTPFSLLQKLALEQPPAEEAYRLAGASKGPLDGFPEMGPHLFL